MAKQLDCVLRLHNVLGVDYGDGEALRRIAMTLSRWHELECGDGNGHGSWCITRGRKENGVFIHDDDGKPFSEHHHYLHGRGKDYVTYSPMPDRERGALKRLAAIMAHYPELCAYVQTDPRGHSLYILRKSDIPEGSSADMVYNSRGVALYK